MGMLRPLPLAMALTVLAACGGAPDEAPVGLEIAEDEIYHMGFVVEDLDAAMQQWSEDYGIGPFFVARQFDFQNADYRGRPTAPSVSLAFAFNGEFMIELIQQLDETPSVYTELIERSGYGFHHIAYLRSDVDASVAEAEAMGHECIFRADFAGGRLAYCEPDGQIGPGIVEYVQRSPDVEAMLNMMYEAAAAWDGSELVRTLM